MRAVNKEVGRGHSEDTIAKMTIGLKARHSLPHMTNKKERQGCILE